MQTSILASPLQGTSNSNPRKRRHLLQQDPSTQQMFDYATAQQRGSAVGASDSDNSDDKLFSYSNGVKNSRLAVDQSTDALLENLKKVNTADNVHGVENQDKIIQEESAAIQNQREINNDIEQMKVTAMQGVNSLTNENKKAEYPEIMRAIKWESQHKGSPTKKQVDQEPVVTSKSLKLFSGRDAKPANELKNKPGKLLNQKQRVQKMQPAAAVLQAKREIEKKNEIIKKQKLLLEKIEKRKSGGQKKTPKTPMDKDSAELQNIENQLVHAENEF